MKDVTIHKRASELIGNGEVAGRVHALRERLTVKALWTREKSVMALEKVLEEGPHAAQVSAVKELKLMHGFNEPIKLDLTSSDGSMSPKQPVYKIVSE